MNAQTPTETARSLVAGDKGLLAMDESTPACNKRFAKWRAVIYISEAIPTPGRIGANVHALARYAALRQEAGSCRSWSRKC